MKAYGPFDVRFCNTHERRPTNRHFYEHCILGVTDDIYWILWTLFKTVLISCYRGPTYINASGRAKDVLYAYLEQVLRQCSNGCPAINLTFKTWSMYQFCFNKFWFLIIYTLTPFHAADWVMATSFLLFGTYSDVHISSFTSRVVLTHTVSFI